MYLSKITFLQRSIYIVIMLSTLALLNGCTGKGHSSIELFNDSDNASTTADPDNTDTVDIDDSDNDSDSGSGSDSGDDVSNSSFKSVWRVGNSDYGDGKLSIAFPLKKTDRDRNEFEYEFTVDWGDGSRSETFNTESISADHKYAEAGDYTVKIEGPKFPTLYLYSNDRNKLIEVKNLGVVGWKDFSNAFYQCKKLSEFTVGNTDTSEVSDMSQMFYYSRSLTSLDLSGLDTSKVTDMSAMFFSSAITSVDLSGLDTSKVTNTRSMFYGAQKLASADLSDWNVSGLRFASGMFTNTPKLIELNVQWGSFTGIEDQRAFLGSPVNFDLVINCSTSGADFFEKTCN